MKYPKLNEIPYTRDLLDKFRGYNHNLRIGEGEFYDMQNLTGDDYPVLSPRKKRGIAITTTNPNGMCSNTQLCYVDGGNFYIGNTKYDLGLTNDTKTLISMGATIVVMPDQKYINTVNPEDRGSIRNGVYELPLVVDESKSPAVMIQITGLEDVPRAVVGSKNNLPHPTSNLWYEETASMVITSEQVEWYRVGKTDKDVYKWIPSNYMTDYYQEDSGNSYYVRAKSPSYQMVISCSDVGDKGNWSEVLEQIKTAMGTEKIYLNGVLNSLTNNAIRVWIKDGQILLPSNHLSSYWEADKHDAVLKELLFDRTDIDAINTPYEKKGTISIIAPYNAESDIPMLDYLIESGNRLWGCRYGANNNGDWVNEVYATQLGDFKVWFKYDGVSTDSWTASVGTSGAFTGAINYGGKPIFFKEDCMHRVYGDYVPYSLQMIPCKGVQEGCAKSLAIVNDVLYYKSRTGVCAYDGSLPVEISTNFGDKQYKNAVGGALGNKYYLSMQDEEGKWHLFVYDTIKRLWHREDETQAKQFCNHKGELYYIDYSDNYIHSVKGTGVLETEPIKWYGETGILGATTPDDKYVTKLDIRMTVAKGSKMSLHIEYDSMGDWERLIEIEGLTLNTFTIPVRPRRCDHFRLKFEGEGDAKIYSISKTMEEVK